MTNQQYAIILKHFYEVIGFPAISSADTDVVFGITEAFMKAINLLEQTPDTLTQQPFKFKIGDKVMSTEEPGNGVGVIDAVNKHKSGYYYDIAYERSYALFVPEKELTNVN